MKPLIAIAIAAVATPVLAQHAHHGAGQEAQTDPHAQHQMDEHGGSAHAGHSTPPAPEKDAHNAHAGHEPGIPDPAAGPSSAAALSGPDHAADVVFGTSAMAGAREVVRREHGDIKGGMILIDQLEAVAGKGADGYAWDAQGWYGGDIDKLWIKTEGEDGFGERLDSAEVQALWSHALDPWWNLQAGIRHDFGAGPDRSHAVVAIQGLAPYWFEVDGALFLSDKGDVTARIEAEYDQRLTRKLILQPAAEFNMSAQDIPEQAIGAGLSTAEFALRLRYEIVPEFAPYVGVKYERAFDDTANFRRARGEEAGGWNFLIGIRAWF